MADNTHLLEINLISAQGLKPPSTALRRLQTYAVVWVDPSTKLRTRIDRLGAENPTWNDKFIFRVAADFLAGETSAVTVEIFAVGFLKDHFLGSVRFLLSNFISPTNPDFSGAPAFIAVQVRRSSGRFHGILNVGAMMIDGSGLGSSLSGVSAIGYRDLMGKNRRKKHQRGFSDMSSGSGSWGGESADFSDGTESTASTSSSTVLKELNGEREMAGRKEEGEGMILCGLGFQKKIHISNIHALGSLDLKECR